MNDAKVSHRIDPRAMSYGCAFGQGLAVVLKGSDLNMMATFVKLLSDVAKAELSTRQVKSITDLFFNAKNKKIPLKQLTKATVSLSKAIIAIVPKTLGAITVPFLKKSNIVLTYAKFVMDVAEIVANHKKYFENGATKEDVLKFCCSIAYQLFINVAFFVLRNASLARLVGGVSIAFVSYRIFLEKNGMLPVVKVGESIDRIFIGRKPDPITKIYMRVLGMMTCMHATYSIIKMVNADVPERKQETTEQITSNELNQIKVRENDSTEIKQNILPAKH